MMRTKERLVVAEVILLRGRPGVGKTTISDRLSAELNIPIFRKDDMYDIIAGYNDDHNQRNRMCYAILRQMLRTNAVVQGRLLLDFPFNGEQDMRRFAGWLEEQRIRLIPVLCICSNESLWAERFNRRKLDPAPNQLITDFDELKGYVKDLTITPYKDELIVDAVQPLDTIIRQILAYLNES
jgi:adenylate kinase family enzyme